MAYQCTALGGYDYEQYTVSGVVDRGTCDNCVLL